MKLLFSVRSHKGNIKKNNEDNLYADGLTLLPKYCNRPYSADAYANTPAIFAVFDGVGGMENGEFASNIAATKLAEFQEIFRNTKCNDLSAFVQQYVNIVHNDIDSSAKRTGTTLALAIVTNKGLHCYNVGDSRIYCLKGSNFSRVTTDHTKGTELAQKQNISMEQARCHPDGNKLTRCIGYGKKYNVDAYPMISGKCRLLICSDGLSDMIPDIELCSILRSNKLIPDCADKLIDVALKKGGKDNITFVIFDILPYSIKDHFIDIFRKWR